MCLLAGMGKVSGNEMDPCFINPPTEGWVGIQRADDGYGGRVFASGRAQGFQLCACQGENDREILRLVGGEIEIPTAPLFSLGEPSD